MDAKTMTMNSLTTQDKAKSMMGRISRDNIVLFGLLAGLSTMMILFILMPLWAMLVKSVQNSDGEFVGLANFATYFSSSSLWVSVGNTFSLGLVVTTVVGILAFGYAYALTRSCMPFKGLFHILGTAPILAPSLLPAISLIFLFGNQGVAKELLGGHSVYGVIGISMGLIFWTFPHALMILTTSLRTSDARLYEAARALKTSPMKTFFMVTLPAAKYGLISTLIVVFTLVITDFGVPKVIGGSYNVLATDIFKQVVGQQSFAMGAVTSIMLLFPAVMAFGADRWVQKKQKSLFDTRSVPYQPEPNKTRDGLCFVYCSLISVAVLTVLGMAVYGSLVTFWPWNKALTLNNYNFAEMSTYGWSPFFNSLTLAGWTALIGTTVIFVGAYCIEKGRAFGPVRQAMQMLSVVPMAVPGMVLGLGYIFYFNDVNNPLNVLYGTMAFLVINTVVHYYTVGHMTALTALKQLPSEIEATAASVKLPQYKLFFKVTLPVCMPAVLDIATYLFVNALTTTSAVVFLYSTDTIPASVSILNMDDAGQTGAAAAMAVMIMIAAAIAKIVQMTLGKWLESRTQAWRKR
ncbi:TPA: putative 2-aminoethylphosphonate ABC transporter permease subunit [Vibrio parahaemolyticus]|uniref:putative 2-aminoethylphosphonate ABC transporter permease subunit n=1 Tax=Vibrio parahaemolyticus TaxID=670 RepID=UPI00146CA4EE|nr:putative 2-aminoethylphosphonate ABC transporter permease subunit [Vibrio parahaemolyticus]EJL3949547.1 putative 2-aminoethylphosphonate ABC transporter permease subunit [Vibrio parahaemolyticus]MDF4695558.1 putative 2-aminoethylphosphonate ABC transporter permease subunit [Vibrio parahaemolyticus]MDF4723661.1 putative 2-aminoethylphosphonate ABC transporter permease subunit [Vibrio parahaemolyticus]MDF5023156.1 putative 2-aminoethylphosphonate ABC transporter permease subunit [Vibrio paraha